MRFLFTLAAVVISLHALSQNVGIGTTTPKARFHVADSTVLFSGGLSTTLPANPGILPVSGSGVRMMWLPTRAAFRAGGVSTTQWNEANIGEFSAAFGQNNTASGSRSFAAGSSNSASGIGSIALGSANSATGNFALALGSQATASAFGSVVIGRYNLIAGTADEWVDSDPLFVIGNGGLQEVQPGVMQLVRSNALTISKTGVATFHKSLRTDDALRVAGTASFDKTVNMKSGFVVEGSGVFQDNAYVNGKLSVDTVENLKVLNATYANGTNPEVNLVPLGVVEFSASYSTTPLNNTPTTTYRNLAANLVTSVTGLYDQGLLIGDDAIVGIRLNFNANKVGDYKEIIAVGHSDFDGIGTSGNTILSRVGTTITKDLVTNIPINCIIRFEASDLPQLGSFHTKGIYMFYGLK